MESIINVKINKLKDHPFNDILYDKINDPREKLMKSLITNKKKYGYSNKEIVYITKNLYILSGVLCAETISTSTCMSKPSNISIACCIIGRSLVLPIIIPTSGMFYLFANYFYCFFNFLCYFSSDINI